MSQLAHPEHARRFPSIVFGVLTMLIPGGGADWLGKE
jgi:hypothetical protein